MTDKNKKTASPEEAAHARLIRKVARHERFKRNLLTGSLVGATALSPVAAAATDSYDLEPLPDCPSFTSQVIEQDATVSDAAQQAAANLVNAPASNSSMVIQAVLVSAGDASKMELMDRALQIDIHTHADAASQAYGEGCAHRSELRDIRMFNPALYDPATYDELRQDSDNYIEFQALAAYEDPASDNILRAYFEPRSGTLTIAAVGLTPDEGFERVLAVASENTDRVIPYDVADAFINELRRTILENGLTVNRTAIASHSMGTSGGVLVKAMLESSQVNRLLFGKDPSLTLIEGFGESLAAETVSRELDIPLHLITRNSHSLRSLKNGEANIVAHEWEGNHPIGEQVYAVHTAAVDTHALPDMAIGLLNGKREIVPYDGEFRAGTREVLLGDTVQWAAKLAKAGRETREALGLG